MLTGQRKTATLLQCSCGLGAELLLDQLLSAVHATLTTGNLRIAVCSGQAVILLLCTRLSLDTPTSVLHRLLAILVDRIRVRGHAIAGCGRGLRGRVGRWLYCYRFWVPGHMCNATLRELVLPVLSLSMSVRPSIRTATPTPIVKKRHVTRADQASSGQARTGRSGAVRLDCAGIRNAQGQAATLIP